MPSKNHRNSQHNCGGVVPQKGHGIGDQKDLRSLCVFDQTFELLTIYKMEVIKLSSLDFYKN